MYFISRQTREEALGKGLVSQELCELHESAQFRCKRRFNHTCPLPSGGIIFKGRMSDGVQVGIGYERSAERASMVKQPRSRRIKKEQ